ncbi:hypothetical protein D3273_25135 [Lichenibacterium minor]|uniref:Glycosyltransferase n=1 Tax=Lichenibacterium minor TaxID=2316528 RepID=A0A4Q2U3B1_9HYPH|nr:hypothetical protein [Lichenibacterium minor]RYC29205.1 hypothetical protein D3273_25135 [Lichenibacterium minor]
MSPHRTLVFCTAHVDDETVWDGRYRRWFDGIAASGIAHDTALMIDDRSGSVPGWSDLTILCEGERERGTSPKMLYRFEQNLGRRSLFDFPGWHRSFTFACRFADRHGFDKVVHVESDTFVISRRLRDYIDAAADDWIALWCSLHGFPEITIQVMAGAGLAAYRTFSDIPHEALVGRPYEGQIPFTRVETGFIGDRYGERLPYVPVDADFVSQAPEADRSYFWWFPTGVGDLSTISEDGASADRYMTLETMAGRTDEPATLTHIAA